MLPLALLQKLKAEVTSDPDKIYGGRTPAQIAAAMSQPIAVVTDVLYAAPPPPPPQPKVGDKIGETIAMKDPPVFRVINGVAAAPNAFTAQDISDALAS